VSQALTFVTTLDQALTILRAQAPGIEARHGVRVLGVFGSLARGQAGPDSDIDVLAETIGQPDMYDILAVEEELAAAFGRPVDLAFEKALRPHWLALVRADFVAA
jgi:uncharacterized protein